jgi:hypothetical protein
LTCLLCTISEKQFDLNKNQRVAVKHPKDITGLICSNCMQILIATKQGKVKEAYDKALKDGLMDKAKVLETLLEEEEHDVRETKKPSRDMDRARALRKVRSAGHKIRQEHTTKQLDKRRIAAC